VVPGVRLLKLRCNGVSGVDVPIPTLPEPCWTTKLFAPVIPPANVDVAVVEVALIAATCGVEEETRLPEPSVVMTIFAPVPVKARFVAKRLVNVPLVEKKLVVVA